MQSLDPALVAIGDGLLPGPGLRVGLSWASQVAVMVGLGPACCHSCLVA